MESIIAGMESGEYFSQLQLQSPQLSQAPFSIQSQQQQIQQHSGQLTTPMMTPSPMNGQFDYSSAASALAVSTPLLVSQGQTVFDMSGVGVASTMVTTPTISMPTSMAMDGSTGYGGYPTFSSTTTPLFSSPPAISSPGTFTPTTSNMSNYFTSQQQQASPQHSQYFSNGAIVTSGVALKSSPQATNDTSIAQGGSDNMFMAAPPGMGVWDSYPTPLIQQQQEQLQLSGDVQQAYQHQQHDQSPPLNSVGGINGVPSYTVTTPPTTPQRHPRLLHSQSQPGLRNLQQEQLLQQQQQIQQTLRRRQHSVHFPNELLLGDQTTMRTRHVSLPGSYSAPIPSLASLYGMMQDSPLGAAAAAAAGAGPIDATAHGFSFLDNPPPPMPHQHQLMPTSPPLSSTDLSTPTTPKTRSRAGSKSRSRPASTSSAISVRNASAPYSPSIASNTVQSGVGHSRSPSLVPLSPGPPFNHASATDPEMVGPPTPAYETGLIIVPGASGATAAGVTGNGAGATTTVQGSTGGKARRVSRSKVTTKTRSRSSTITSTNSALGTPSETTAGLINSPFSLLITEQDEQMLKGLEQSAIDGRTTTTPGEEVDTFQLDPAAQLQQQHLDSGMFDLSLIPDMDEEDDSHEGDSFEGDLDLGDESLGMGGSAGALGVPSSSTSSSSASTASSSPAPGKPIPCPIPSCSKSFTRHFNLTAHVKSHDTLKPYGCHVCTRVFSRKHDLQRHIRVHTGSKPYVCVNCQKAFARTDALCRHYKVEEPCRMFMQQDEVRKQAQQQVQQQLHQEQIELQQAQEAHAKAKAEAEAQAQAQAQAQLMLKSEELSSGELLGVPEAMETKLTMSMPLSMDQTLHQHHHHQHQQLHQHVQQFQQHQQLAHSALDMVAAMTPSAAANQRDQDQAQP